MPPRPGLMQPPYAPQLVPAPPSPYGAAPPFFPGAAAPPPPAVVNPYADVGKAWSDPVWKSNLQPDFNVRVIERIGPDSFAVLRELDESNRSVQKSAESTSI